MEQSPRILHLCPPSAQQPRPRAQPRPRRQTKGTSSPHLLPFHPQIAHFIGKSSTFRQNQSATYLLPICYLSATYLLPSATICYHLLPSATARHPVLCAHLSPTGAFQFGGRFWVRSRSHPPWVALRVCRTRAQRIALGGSSCLTRRTGRTGPQTEMLPLDRGCFASGSKCPILGFGPRERAWRIHVPQCRPLGDGAPQHKEE